MKIAEDQIMEIARRAFLAGAACDGEATEAAFADYWKTHAPIAKLPRRRK